MTFKNNLGRDPKNVSVTELSYLHGKIVEFAKPLTDVSISLINVDSKEIAYRVEGEDFRTVEATALMIKENTKPFESVSFTEKSRDVEGSPSSLEFTLSVKF